MSCSKSSLCPMILKIKYEVLLWPTKSYRTSPLLHLQLHFLPQFPSPIYGFLAFYPPSFSFLWLNVMILAWFSVLRTSLLASWCGDFILFFFIAKLQCWASSGCSKNIFENEQTQLNQQNTRPCVCWLESQFL